MPRCKFCDDIYVTQGLLDRHLEESGCGSKTYPCGHCQEHFPSPRALDLHSLGCRANPVVVERLENQARQREAQEREVIRQHRAQFGPVFAELRGEGRVLGRLPSDSSTSLRVRWSDELNDLEFVLGGSVLARTGAKLGGTTLTKMIEALDGADFNIGCAPNSDRVTAELRDGAAVFRFDLSTWLSSDLPGENVWWSVTLTIDALGGEIRVFESYDGGG